MDGNSVNQTNGLYKTRFSWFWWGAIFVDKGLLKVIIKLIKHFLSSLHNHKSFLFLPPSGRTFTLCSNKNNNLILHTGYTDRVNHLFRVAPTDHQLLSKPQKSMETRDCGSWNRGRTQFVRQHLWRDWTEDTEEGHDQKHHLSIPFTLLALPYKSMLC